MDYVVSFGSYPSAERGSDADQRKQSSQKKSKKSHVAGEMWLVCLYIPMFRGFSIQGGCKIATLLGLCGDWATSSRSCEMHSVKTQHNTVKV